MFSLLREFKIGRPQIFAGLLLLVFLLQTLWVASTRRLSGLEYEFIASGLRIKGGEHPPATSPLTSGIAALPVRLLAVLRDTAPASMRTALTMPRPWIFRLPFVFLGLWLGGAIWWVARRLFGDGGGYTALALFCLSPAMVKIGSNIGPEIILAWSSFGLIYTAIGVAHTVYAPPRKWIPRIVVLGFAIGICIATELWAFTIVLPAFALMLYLTPGCRKTALMILLSASAIGLAILGFVFWIAGDAAWVRERMTPRPTLEVVQNLGFAFADSDHYLYLDFVVPMFMAAALTVYGSWPRARYFGNTAPLMTSFSMVLLFALVPTLYLWKAPLGLSFLFLFIAGVAADLFETPYGKVLSFVLFAILAIKGVLGLSLLRAWIHQNPM
jgi:hypothetical protein